MYISTHYKVHIIHNLLDILYTIVENCIKTIWPRAKSIFKRKVQPRATINLSKNRKKNTQKH